MASVADVCKGDSTLVLGGDGPLPSFARDRRRRMPTVAHSAEVGWSTKPQASDGKPTFLPW